MPLEQTQAPSKIKRIVRLVWKFVVGLFVCGSIWLLFNKLQVEVASDPATKALLDNGGIWSDIKVIAAAIASYVIDVPIKSHLFAGLSALAAYLALAWYDRIALMHLNRLKGISWPYVAICSFVTYALGHNLGASILSGGIVRLRAYCAKGLKATEVAALVAMCSFTFLFGSLLLLGVVLVFEPEIVLSLSDLIPRMTLPVWLVQAAGIFLLILCTLYVVGSWRTYKPFRVGTLDIVYPRLGIVGRQLLAAPLEIMSAAGIIYFVLPEASNPGYFVVLGAFILSFSAGLVSQAPGGLGVMEAVFLAIIDTVPPTGVIAALLIWRLLYLMLPLALSIPVILIFERSQASKYCLLREDEN
ncbi:YbhN family protein [Desulfobulbus sp.]|uniref:lysylphosphatidylglycerol synthase transmembrane domain-containing protein n=1 Tax=Desulfobulbus sp. TaxID=895 RepID=UPI00286F4B06|nr:YbhN family protein [Desulfobulbus sp.]